MTNINAMHTTTKWQKTKVRVECLHEIMYMISFSSYGFIQNCCFNSYLEKEIVEFLVFEWYLISFKWGWALMQRLMALMLSIKYNDAVILMT